MTNDNVNQKVLNLCSFSYLIFSIIDTKFKQKIIPHTGKERKPMNTKEEKNIYLSPIKLTYFKKAHQDSKFSQL